MALSALLDSAEKLAPGKKVEENEPEPKPASSKRLELELSNYYCLPMSVEYNRLLYHPGGPDKVYNSHAGMVELSCFSGITGGGPAAP